MTKAAALATLAATAAALSSTRPRQSRSFFRLAPSAAYDTRVAVDGSWSLRIPPDPREQRSLSEYMRLPTEQYSMLSLPYGASLRRPGADGVFELTVPPVTFLWLEVAPLVRATVDTHAETDAVIITSTDCKLRGSDVIERIRLNEAFRFFVRTRITWVDDGSERRLATDTQIRVQVEPPGPFATVPRAVLEATGNAVMKVAMEGVQRGFVRALARDFEQWACDASYRTRRAGGP